MKKDASDFISKLKAEIEMYAGAVIDLRQNEGPSEVILDLKRKRDARIQALNMLRGPCVSSLMKRPELA